MSEHDPHLTRLVVALTDAVEATPADELASLFLERVGERLTSVLSAVLVVDDCFEFRPVAVHPPDASVEGVIDRLVDAGEFGRATSTGATVVADLGVDAAEALLVPLAAVGRIVGMALFVGPPGAGTSGATIELAGRVLATRLAAPNASAEPSARTLAEIDRLNLDLERAVFQLRQAQSLRDDLGRMIVHDLRTPMTSVKSALDLMKMGAVGEFDAGEKELVDLAAASSDRVIGMIGDLLDIERIESGRLSLDRQDIGVDPLLREVVGALTSIASADRGKGFEIDIPDPTLRVDADTKLLRRVMENLLSNAIKFSPAAGVITVCARRSDEPRFVEISVRDLGEGIPEGYRERVFERFVQVESRRRGRRLGTGLGLAFCRLAVEAHGGEISVESDLDVGSTFRLSLPIASASGASPSAPRPFSAGSATTRSSTAGR